MPQKLEPLASPQNSISHDSPKWTLGPWELDGTDIVADRSYMAYGTEQELIASVYAFRVDGSSGMLETFETRANARLISCSPQFYETLKAILNHDGHMTQELFAQAVALIRKAEKR